MPSVAVHLSTFGLLNAQYQRTIGAVPWTCGAAMPEIGF